MKSQRNPADYISEKINDDLTLTNCVRTYVNDKGETKNAGDFGWWLYDETFGYNLAMKAKSKEEALIEALTHYNEYFKKERAALCSLQLKVNSFLVQFPSDDDGDE
jgi:hypothetical protein